ncbi:MAG: 4'-phosphopantetheinyl transferase superfamily protein [Balneolaceae bacterium]
MEKIDTTQIKNWPEGVVLAVSELKQDLSPDILSAEEKQEFDSFLNFKRKAEYLLARYLFRFLLNELGINPAEVELLKEEKGKPYAIYGDELINVSFTHSPELVLCAVSKEKRIGLDIESVDRVINKRVIKRILNEKEWKIIGQEDPLRLWTIKEAALKCAGTGLQTNLLNLNIYKKEKNRYSIRFNDDITYEICSFKQSGHQVALAYQSIIF